MFLAWISSVLGMVSKPSPLEEMQTYAPLTIRLFFFLTPNTL